MARFIDTLLFPAHSAQLLPAGGIPFFWEEGADKHMRYAGIVWGSRAKGVLNVSCVCVCCIKGPLLLRDLGGVWGGTHNNKVVWGR